MATGLAHFKQTSKVKAVDAAIAWIDAWPETRKRGRFRELDLCLRGARAGAEKFGYRLEELSVSKEMPLSRIEKILSARNIRGILILPHGGLQVDWHRLNWEHFSAVRLGRPSEDLPMFHSVAPDQVSNAALAFSKMRERGYERIGFLGVGTWHRAGFLQCQCEEPEERRVPPFTWPTQTPATVIPELEKWLKRYKPDAILTEMREAVDLLTKAGYQIPGDIALAGTTVLDIPGVDAGIDQHPSETGRVASLSLISLINENDQGTPAVQRQILIKGEWVDGKSLPKRH
jgi:DNA-binding LacI/PurR family transcriptional regulator